MVRSISGRFRHHLQPCAKGCGHAVQLRERRVPGLLPLRRRSAGLSADAASAEAGDRLRRCSGISRVPYLQQAAALRERGQREAAEGDLARVPGGEREPAVRVPAGVFAGDSGVSGGSAAGLGPSGHGAEGRGEGASRGVEGSRADAGESAGVRRVRRWNRVSVCCVLGGVGHRASVQGAAARGAAHRAGGKPRSAVTMLSGVMDGWLACLTNTQCNEQHSPTPSIDQSIIHSGRDRWIAMVFLPLIAA